MDILGLVKCLLVLVVLMFRIDGKIVAKPYTPCSCIHQTGTFDLVVKGYETGFISKYIVSRKVGDKVLVKGLSSLYTVCWFIVVLILV